MNDELGGEASPIRAELHVTVVGDVLTELRDDYLQGVGVEEAFVRASVMTATDAFAVGDQELLAELMVLVARLDRQAVTELMETTETPGRVRLATLAHSFESMLEALRKGARQPLDASSAAGRMLRLIRTDSDPSSEEIGEQLLLTEAEVASAGLRLERLGLAQPTRYRQVGAWSPTEPGRTL